MADGLLNWYKGELKKEGKDVSRFTDDQLTYELGRKIEGKYGAQKINEYPAFAKQYKKINNDLRAKRLGRDGFLGPIKEIGAGFGQGVDETQAMIQGGIGAGFKTVGLDSAGDYMMDAAMANLKESQVNAPTIQSYQDVTGIGDAVRYLTGGLGRVLPSGGTMLATGGVTGAVGKKVLEKSVVGPALRKALKDKATKNIAKEGLKKETFDQLSPDAQDIAKAYAYGVSQNVGVGTASGTMGIGEVYTSLYPYTQLDPQDKDYLTEGEALGTSWMFGTAIGSLDSILPSMVGKSVQRKFFKGKSPNAVDLAKADNFTKRSILALTAKGMAVEAGTEATQEYLNVVADKFAHDEKSPFDLSQFTDQEIATMIDAGILGSIGGGVFGVAGGKIENWQTDRKVEQVTKELTEKKRDAEKRVKDILEKLAGETDIVPTFTKGDSVFDVAEGKEYEFVSATGEVAKVKDGEETKEVSIRNLTQAVKKQEEQAETTEETTEDVQDVVQSFQDDIPEKKPDIEEETVTPEEKTPTKQEKRAEVLAKFEEARNVQLELENDEGKVIIISAPQARVLEIVGDSNYKQEISKENYKTWADEFYAPGQQPSKKEMSATYDQAFEVRYPKLVKELQETKDTAEEAKKTGTEKKEKDETFLRNDVIADKNLKRGAKVTLNQRGRLQANSALGLDVDQARQEFEITEIDDQGFVKIKGGGVTLKQGVDPRNFNKFVEKTPPKPKVVTPAPTPPATQEPVEEIDGSELTEIPALEKGEYVVTFEGLKKQKTTKIESTGGTSLADFLYLGVEQTSFLYKATTILTPSNQRIGIEFDGVKFKYSINSDQNKEIVSREANPSNGYWGDDINLSNEQDKVRIIEGQELVIDREESTTDNIKSATKDWAKQKTQFDVENKDNVTLVVLEDTQGGVYVRQLKSTTNKDNKRQLKILDFKSTSKTGTFPSLRDNSHSMSIEDAKELGFVVTRVIGFVGPKIRGGFKDQYETIGELDAWLSTIQKAESAVALTDMSDIKKLEYAKKKLQEFEEGENIEDEETILLLDTFRHSNGEYDKDKAGDPIVDLSIGFFNPTKEQHGRNKLSVILPTLKNDLINHALKAAERVSKKSDENQGGIYTPPESTEDLEKRLDQLLESGVISGDANNLRQFAVDLLKAVYASQAPSFRSSSRISLDQPLSEDGGTFGDTIGSLDEEVEVSDSVARIGVEFSDAGNGDGLMVLESANGLTKGDILLQVSDDEETVNLQNTTDGRSIATADAMVHLKQFIAKRIGSTVQVQVRAKTDSMETSSMLPTREVKVLSANDNNGASIPEAFRGHTDNDIPPSEELANLATEETAELQRLGKELGKKPAINLSSGVEVNPAAIDFAHLYAIRTARKGDIAVTKNLLSKAIEAIQTSEEGYADSEADRIIRELQSVAGVLNTSELVKSAIKLIADDFYANDLVELLEILSESAVGYFKKEGSMHDFFWGVLGNPSIHLNISEFKSEHTSAGSGNRGGGNVPLHNPINKSIGAADPTPGKKFNGGKVDPLNESEEAAKVLSQENDNGPAMTKVFDISPQQMSEIKERNRAIIDEVLDNYDLGAAAGLENINNEEFISEEAEQFIEEIINVLDEGMKAALNEGRDIKVDVAELPQPRQGITRAQFNPDTNIITIDPRFYLGEKDTSITPYEITGDRNRDILITAFIHEVWHATLDTPIDVHEKALIEGKTTKYAETYDLIQEVIKELGVLDKGNQYGLLNEDAIVESLNRIWTRPDFARWANGQKLSGELQKKIDTHTKTSSGSILDALHALYIKLLELMDINIVEGNSFDSLIRLSKKMQEVHATTAETPEISTIEKSADASGEFKIVPESEQSPKIRANPFKKAADRLFELTDKVMEIEQLSPDDLFSYPPQRSSNFTSQGGGTDSLWVLPKNVMIEPERTTEFKKAIKKHLKEVDKKFNLGLFEKYQGQEGISKLAGEVYAMREIYDMMYEQFRTQKPESAKFMSDSIAGVSRAFLEYDEGTNPDWVGSMGNPHYKNVYNPETQRSAYMNKKGEIIDFSADTPIQVDRTLEKLSDDELEETLIVAKNDRDDLENWEDDSLVPEGDIEKVIEARSKVEALELEQWRRDVAWRAEDFVKNPEEAATDPFNDLFGKVWEEVKLDNDIANVKVAMAFEAIKKHKLEGKFKDFLKIQQRFLGSQVEAEDAEFLFETQMKKAVAAYKKFSQPQPKPEAPTPESAKFMSDSIRKDTRTHIRLEADGDGYIVTNLEDKPVRLSLEEAKKIVRFIDNPSRVGRLKLKGDGSELTKTEEESISSFDAPLPSDAITAIQAGDLKSALEAVAKTPNKSISQTALKLLPMVGGTRIRVAKENLPENSSGIDKFLSQKMRGVFGTYFPSAENILKKVPSDEQTKIQLAQLIKEVENTIVLNEDEGMSISTLLHEMTHAVTTNTLRKPEHPVTKELQAIYDSVKDQLEGEYAAESLEEFVAESFSNLSFQKKLSGIKKGGQLSAIDRFINAIRKLFGLPENTQSLFKEVETLIEQIIAPAPEKKFVEYARVIENGNDFWVKRDDIEAYDRRDTIKQMSDQLTFDFDKSEEQVEKEKKLAPEVVDTPKYTPQELTAVVAKNISWGGDNDGIHRSIARKISKGTGIPYNRVLNEIYVLNRMHEDTPIRYRTKFMDEAERGYKRYYGRRKFMVDELDPNIEDRSDEIVGKKPVVEQNKRDTIRMEAASINEVSGVIAQAIQVVREKMGIEENITADSILKVLGVKGTRPGRRMQALLKLSGGDETMKTATTGSMRNNENMYQEANERSLQKLDAIINNATKEKTGALELIKQNEEKIEENSEIKPDASFIFNLAKTGDKLRKEIVKQLENTATALNNNEEYANDPILEAFEKLKGENESADIEQLERASKISGKYITDLIDKVINSGGDITLEKLYNNISLDIKDDRAVVLAAVLTSKAGIEQIAFRMLARSGNVNQKRTTIEKLVGIYKANEMQLAQIKRVVGSDEYRATYDKPFIKGANNPEYIVINEFIARREDIFKRQKQNKELARRIQGIDALTSVVAQASERKKILLRHNPASYIMDGTEMPVMKKEGDEYVMDKITVRLNNSLKPADYEEFKKALIANRQYLMDPNLVKDQVDENGYALFGSTTYNYVKSMTLKGEALTVFREHEEAVRGLKTWWLKSNPDLWKRFGTEGREIARMLISADVASREAMPKFRAVSRKYNRALLTAAREMGYTTTNKTFGVPTQEVDTNGFVDHVIDPLLKWNEDNPSFGGLTRKEFYAKAYDYAKNLIGDRQPSPEARNALYELLDNYDNITTMLKQLGEKHGLYVQNDRRKVMNYFTGKMEPVSRAPIRRGYMTVPRRFKPKFVADLVRRMADNKGWGDRDSELSKAQLTEYVSGSATDEEKNALMDQWIDTRIDEDVLEDFIYPYIKNTSPRHLLTTVDGTAISTVEMTDAWAKSEGRGAERFKSWIDGLYESLSHKKDRSDYTAFKLKVINAFNGRFFQMHSALELSGKSNDNKAYAMAHALMDSRAQDAIIPIEFLEYETFDEISINRQVEQIIGHAIYGRSGEKLNTMIDNLGNSLEGRVGRLEKEVQRVGGKMAEGLEPMLTQTQKNEIINNIGEEQFDSLIRAVRNWSNFSKAKDQLGKYFESDSGPTQDEKFAFDALGTMSFLILQQVKSGLTNILSLGDQMVVYKGLNKYSIKATANSASNLMGQFFGGLLENLGVQLKGNEYAEQLMPTFFNTEENSVGFMDYTLNIGARGAKKASKLETFKLDGLRRLRQAMTYSPVSEGRRTAPVGLRTLFLHPFTYLSNLTNHSLAVSAARMVDGMVREVTAFLEANPNLPQDYEVTADDLGLKSGVTGSSKELFEYINNSLEERTMGTLTNLSRKYIDRKARGDMRVLTKDQVLAVGTIALHKVAMEGGFSSKPSFMYTNQIARAGAPLQAWSFAKVDQMMEQMRDQEKGNYQAAAMIRLLATTAFWLVPVGMMFTFGMDEYDEEVLGKASALRPAPLSTAIPIFGPFMEGDPKGNALAMFERLGRAGNIGGVAFDFLANIMADIDPYNHNRGFSLDTRILAMAQILNLKDALKNIIHSGTFDYQLVQRPLMYTMGMNGYLQTHQAITNLFDIDSDERRVSNMIGNRNKVRAALANLGIERAPMTGGSFRATRFSVQIRRMERAAYANDSEEFRDAYREAVEASAERGDEDPEKSVLQAFKRRNLRSGISKYKLSDDEWRKVQGVFTDEHASSLRHAMGMHEKFVNILESSSAVLPSPVIMDSTSTNPVPFVAPISYNEIIRRSLQL